VSRVARPIPTLSLALALAGVGVSTYLTIAHYTSPEILACSASGTIDCARVTTSEQSTVLGIPVAVLGLVFFVAMSLLCLPVAWRSDRRAVHRARLAATTIGIAFVLWLVYAELFIIGAICLWCTVAHVLAFGLFAITLVTAPDTLATETREGDPTPQG
jgi:uncharacterized membrane protein